MTGRNPAKLALVALAILVLVAPAASAAQMDATDSPEVSGELELATENCQTQNERHEGRTVARGKTCLRIYTYDPGSETDNTRNYGVAWLQSNVNSRLGWCTSKAVADIDLPANFEVESRTPRSMDVNRRRTFESVLTPDAGGNASKTADDSSIRQTQVIYPRTIRTWLTAETNIFRLKWLGLKDEKLGFASGVEMSWPSQMAPDRLTYRLNYRLLQDDC